MHVLVNDFLIWYKQNANWKGSMKFKRQKKKTNAATVKIQYNAISFFPVHDHNNRKQTSMPKITHCSQIFYFHGWATKRTTVTTQATTSLNGENNTKAAPLKALLDKGVVSRLTQNTS